MSESVAHCTEPETPEAEPASVHFYLTEHTLVSDLKSTTRTLQQHVQAADVVFIETVGWQTKELEFYNRISRGEDKAYYQFRSIIRKVRGDNSFAEARINAVKDSGRPVYIADAPSSSAAHRERQEYVGKGISFGRDLPGSLKIIGSELKRMAEGIDERHGYFLSTVDSVMTGQINSPARGLVIYGAGHSSLPRHMAARGYSTSHEYAELPIVCDYKSDILRKLEFGVQVPERDLLNVFVQNLVEASKTLHYPRVGSAKSVGQRAVAEAFTYEEAERLHDLSADNLQQGFAHIGSMAPRLQRVMDNAISRHSRLHIHR